MINHSFLCQYSIMLFNQCHGELFSLLLKSEGRGNLEKQGSLAQSTSILPAGAYVNLYCLSYDAT
jgi:hypothetical protein